MKRGKSYIHLSRQLAAAGGSIWLLLPTAAAIPFASYSLLTFLSVSPSLFTSGEGVQLEFSSIVLWFIVAGEFICHGNAYIFSCFHKNMDHFFLESCPLLWEYGFWFLQQNQFLIQKEFENSWLYFPENL